MLYNRNMKHVCEIMYDIAANNIVYGDTTGICRITGKQSKGIAFEKWVRRTFTDFAYLKAGTIISKKHCSVSTRLRKSYNVRRGGISYSVLEPIRILFVMASGFVVQRQIKSGFMNLFAAVRK